LNHGIRGSSAEADAAFVAELCAQWGVPCEVGRRDVPALATEYHVSVEQAARTARYEFLREAAAHCGCTRIALGHTASDRVETVLLNVLRGTGLKGLRGIAAVNGELIRPLILVRREETAAYCAACGLQFRQDCTNLDTEGNVRNRVRLRLLPLLRQEYAPHVEEALLRLAAAAEEELGWTEELVEQAYAGARAVGKDLALNLETLQQLPAGLRSRVLRRALHELRGHLTGIGARHVAALEQLVTEGKVGSEAQLPFEIWAQRGYTNLVISCGPRTPRQPDPWESPLCVPGCVYLPWGGVVEARAEPAPSDVKAAGPWQAFLDREAAASGLKVRTWRDGDRMQPLGMAGSRKLQDLFVDAKVPRAERRQRPVIVDGDGRILWVAGLRIAHRAALQPGATECLHLVWRPAQPVDPCARGL
jgi:tRNA(Ile)-lysidine synthase